MRRISLWIAIVTTPGLAGCDAREMPTEAPAEANAAGGSGMEASAQVDPAVPAESEKPLAIAAAAPEIQWGPCPPGMPDGCQIAVLHGDPSKPNSDILLKVPAGAAIAPHWHSSAERMMLVGGELEVEYQGSPQATLSPGSYAYGPARLPHRADCRSSGPCTLFIAFEGPVDRHSYEGQF